MAYWIPAYLKDMTAYLSDPNAYNYGMWNAPDPGDVNGPNGPGVAGEGGVDLASPTGTPVYALAAGSVIGIGYWKDQGHGVVTTRVDIPGFGSNDLYYQHIIFDPALKIGSKVQRGQKIGTVGEYAEVELGLNANWGQPWGVNHPQGWVLDPRPQIKALMALGDPSMSNSSTGQPLILRAFNDAVLQDLSGKVASSQNIINFMISWAHHEGGGVTNDAKFNPLNTMQLESGSTQAAGLLPGIQSYPDGATGIKATVDALKNGNYPSLVHALSTGDENNLGFNGHPMAANVAGDLSIWVSGKRSPLAQSYILAIMSGAGIPGAFIQGGTMNGGNATDQATRDQWANVSLGEDTNGITVGGATNNVLSGLENINAFFGQLGKIFSNPTGIIKVLAGALLVVAGIVLGIKSLVPGGK